MNFFDGELWIKIGVIALAAHTLLKAIARAIDSDPETENKFEKIVRLIGNVIGYLFGRDPA